MKHLLNAGVSRICLAPDGLGGGSDESDVRSRLDAALAGISDEELEKGAQGSDQQSADGGDADDGDHAPGDGSASDDDDQHQDEGGVEPGDRSAIEAPETFSAELKERFKALPADLQQTLAQWESERNRGVNSKLEEAANLRKAAEAAQEALKPERQRLAQQLEHAISLAQTFNPIIAEGMKLAADGNAGWLKLAREDKAAFIEKRAEFDAEMAKVQGAMAERNRLLSQQQSEMVAHHHQELVKAIPDLADPAKAKTFATDVDKTLRAYRFTPEEISGVVDHRMLLVVQDAMRWRQAEAARKSAATKQKQAPGKVVPPGKGDAGKGTARSEAALKRLKSATSTHDQAAALAALL